MSTQLDQELAEAFAGLASERREQVLEYARWMRDDRAAAASPSESADAALEREFLLLNDEQRERLGDYVGALAADPPRGVPGHALLRFAGTLPEDTLRRMEAAIAEDCERIDHEGW
jgi:hypothetical protein